MLYTFSQSDYPKTELDDYFLYITEKDAVVLWQDGVLLAVKYPDYFVKFKGNCMILEQDILARNLTTLLPQNSKIKLISIEELVGGTENYSPQLSI